jgi:hypothetical protein
MGFKHTVKNSRKIGGVVRNKKNIDKYPNKNRLRSSTDDRFADLDTARSGPVDQGRYLRVYNYPKIPGTEDWFLYGKLSQKKINALKNNVVERWGNSLKQERLLGEMLVATRKNELVKEYITKFLSFYNKMTPEEKIAYPQKILDRINEYANYQTKYTDIFTERKWGPCGNQYTKINTLQYIKEQFSKFIEHLKNEDAMIAYITQRTNAYKFKLNDGNNNNVNLNRGTYINSSTNTKKKLMKPSLKVGIARWGYNQTKRLLSDEVGGHLVKLLEEKGLFHAVIRVANNKKLECVYSKDGESYLPLPGFKKHDDGVDQINLETTDLFAQGSREGPAGPLMFKVLK